MDVLAELVESLPAGVVATDPATVEGYRWDWARDPGAGTPVAVGQIRRDDELSPTADPHSRNTLIPSSDDPAGTELELQRLAAVVGRVELLPAAIGHTDVVHSDSAARAGLGAVTDGEIGDIEFGRRRAVRKVDF